MTVWRWMIAIAVIAFVLPAQAQDRALGTAPPTGPAVGALQGSGPLQLLYIFPGVSDDGGAPNAGVATAVHCTHFSGAGETVQIAVINFNGGVVANVQTGTPLANVHTMTATTHLTALYAEDLLLATGLVNQGVLMLWATTVNMVCTAQVVDAAAAIPNGIDLHGIRFNSWPGTQE